MMLTLRIPRNHTSVFAPSAAMFTFTQAQRQGSRRAPNDRSVCVHMRWKWEENAEAWHGRRVRSHSFFFFFLSRHHYDWNNRYEAEKERTNRRETRKEEPFSCPTFRRGGGGSGFSHPSQGQTLFFMPKQTPGTFL